MTENTPSDAMVEAMARALAKADNIEICSDAQYRYSSYGIRAKASAAVIAEAMAAKDAELAELRAEIEALRGATVKQDLTVGPLALADVASERRRQVESEGWTPEHDDHHSNGDLAAAAACYAAGEMLHLTTTDGYLWPWHEYDWKPSDRRRELVKAGALILAEIERLDRAALGSAE